MPKLTDYPEDFRVLIRAIMEYESDTFYGGNVTMKEAYLMARAMVKSIAKELGSSIDGLMLTEIHELVKDHKNNEGEDGGKA